MILSGRSSTSSKDWAAAKPSFKKQPELYFSHWTGLNGGIFTLYSMAGDIEKATPYAMSVFEAYTETPGQRSSEQLLSLGLVFNNTGHALINVQEFDDADTLLLLALGICFDLEERNYRASLPLKALVFNNLGMSQYNRGRFAEAIPFLEEGLKINRELETRNPLRFQPMTGLLAGNLAMAYMETGDAETSERYFEESLATYRKLIPFNPAGFLVQYATVQENRLMLYQQTKTMLEVIEAQELYFNTLRDLDAVFTGQFTENMAFLCGEIAWNKINVYDYAGAIQKSLEGLEIDPSQSWIYSVLAPAHLLAGNFKEARDIYTKWKDQNYYLDATQTFRQVFRQDLEALEQAGIRNDDFDKIRKILAK
jgi:tetratricopeptide (TPR) repeat protein